MLESYITAMSGTRDIILREQKQITAELTNLKAFMDKQAATSTAVNERFPVGKLTDLQTELSDLISKVQDLDSKLDNLRPVLAECRADERAIYETTLVVLQV